VCYGVIKYFASFYLKHEEAVVGKHNHEISLTLTEMFFTDIITLGTEPRIAMVNEALFAKLLNERTRDVTFRFQCNSFDVNIRD